MKRIGILISGRGSNMVSLCDAVSNGSVPNAEVAIVVSDQKNAEGLDRASDRGVATSVIERGGHSRIEHEREILEVLRSHNVDVVCLAGYMRVLSTEFIDAFRGRILNIHPSLLPSFPGLDVQHQAIEHGVKWSGCTVHLVDESLDGGPIIAQAIVPVLDDDTPETLAARILVEEHKLYPAALATVLSGDYEVDGRRVVVRN